MARVAIVLSEVEVEVAGLAIKFQMYENSQEFEIESTCIPDVSIQACIKSLRDYSRERTAKRRPRVDLGLIFTDSEKFVWEYNALGVFITDMGSYYNVSFMANASVGMQPDDVRDIVLSHIQNTGLYVRRIIPDGVEFPLIESDGWRGWSIELKLSPKSACTFHELFSIRSGICQEIFLPSRELTSPYLILRAIQSSGASVLLGASESEILDVKSAAYDLKKVDEPRWKLELAQDVAQFANAASGGLLLIGYRTKKVNGIDIIEKVTPVQHAPTRLQAYADVLKYRIHPPIGGVKIGSLPVEGNELIYVYVPAQPEENKPYVITGALVDDCYVSTGISIVRRQGDSCIPVTAQEIHAALVVGRARIRGAQK